MRLLTRNIRQVASGPESLRAANRPSIHQCVFGKRGGGGGGCLAGPLGCLDVCQVSWERPGVPVPPAGPRCHRHRRHMDE